jgi:hypothetical protein
VSACNKLVDVSGMNLIFYSGIPVLSALFGQFCFLHCIVRCV